MLYGTLMIVLVVTFRQGLVTMLRKYLKRRIP